MNLQFSQCYIFVSFGNNVGMTIVHSRFLLTPIRMTLIDLECLIHLKVRLADGTLDVGLRMLWLYELTMRD